jgi:hypothetical protein
MGGGIYDVADGDAASTAGISYIPQFGDVASRERERRTKAPRRRPFGKRASRERFCRTRFYPKSFRIKIRIEIKNEHLLKPKKLIYLFFPLEEI